MTFVVSCTKRLQGVRYLELFAFDSSTIFRPKSIPIRPLLAHSTQSVLEAAKENEIEELIEKRIRCSVCMDREKRKHTLKLRENRQHRRGLIWTKGLWLFSQADYAFTVSAK